MMRIAFLGTPEIAVPTLRALAKHEPISAVFANPDRPAGRGHKLHPPPVKHEALSLGCPIFQPESWKDPATRSLWETLGIELAIVVAYGHILPSWMLDSCALGVWNLHFSLLPRWRGASPVHQALLTGDQETGVSLMRLVPAMDAGPVLAQLSHPIGWEDTSESLLEHLSWKASDLLLQHLEQLKTGVAQALPQNPEGITYASKLGKAASQLNVHEEALRLHRKIRALQPWPGVEFKLDQEILKIKSVGRIQPSEKAPGTLSWSPQGLFLTVGEAQALELLKLQRPGKPVQPALQAMQPWGNSGERQIQPSSPSCE